MMSNRIIRGFFVFACTVMGMLWANHLATTYYTDLDIPASIQTDKPKPQASNREEAAATPMEQEAKLSETEAASVLKWTIFGGFIGAGVSLIVLFSLRFVTQELFEKFSPALLAIVVAMVMGYGLAEYILQFWENIDPNISIFLTTSLVLIFGYIGISLGLTRASSWEALIKAVHRHNPKLVDTSVIIDGRIADICATGFIEGTLIVPRFVLKELQMVADSPDVLRRMRGRRGLDILKQLQDPLSLVTVEVVDDDPMEIPDVDNKLVFLARKYNAKILTNDFNLNKVAQVDGVNVLNINDLANALKPAVLPDEQMQVRIVKEGKEATQGVGYLDDGTMVVVDGGKNHVGENVSVLVTSVLQTSAGRMIFTKLNTVLS
ncbi:MAG: hypothetical protein AMXMBFR84_46670 [Candidatus Hydrogenedentota bacterium]